MTINNLPAAILNRLTLAFVCTAKTNTSPLKVVLTNAVMFLATLLAVTFVVSRWLQCVLAQYLKVRVQQDEVVGF